MGVNLMPAQASTAATSVSGHEEEMQAGGSTTTGQLDTHPEGRDMSGNLTGAQPEYTSSYQQ